MRPLAITLLLFGAAGASAAPVPKALQKQDETKRVVGTWRPTSSDSAWFEFGADGTLRTWHGERNNRNSAMNWTYSLVPDSTPRQMKLTRVPDSHNWYDCLYEFDGDTLKFVFLLKNGMTSPQKIEAGKDLQLHQLTRDTSDK